MKYYIVDTEDFDIKIEVPKEAGQLNKNDCISKNDKLYIVNNKHFLFDDNECYIYVDLEENHR